MPGLNSGVGPADLLLGMPGAPWLASSGEVLSRGAVRERLLAAAARLRSIAGPERMRLAWLPSPRIEQLILFLAALEEGHEVCLLPLRAGEAERKERLHESGARALLETGTDGLPGMEPLGDTPPDGDPECAGIRVLSSGSSRRASWSTLSLDALLEAASMVGRALQARPGDAWLLSLPLDHVSGQSLIWRSLVTRGSLRLRGGETLLQDLCRGVQHASLVAAQLEDLLEALPDSLKLPELRSLLLGGSAVSPSLVKRARRRGLPVLLSYGATESCAACCSTRPGEACPAGSVGRPFAGRRLRQHEDGSWTLSGSALARGEPATLGSEAWRIPDRLVWMPGGELNVLGRRDHLLVSGGEKLHPEELEQKIECLAGMRRAVVVALADPRLGQRPAVFLWMDQGVPIPSVGELAGWLEGSLSRIWWPISIWELPEEERLALKPSRRRLQELANQLWRR